MKFNFLQSQAFLCCISAIVFFTTTSKQTKAYTVTSLTAEYRKGQVFLTWTSPAATNLQYNVYRSTSKFSSSTNIKSSKFIGFVRDSSSKNYFWTKQEGHEVFYKIKDNGEPLKAKQGVYVATCTADAAYYYAVTITNLSTGTEDKTIILGENSLNNSVSEKIDQPVPIWQDSIETVNEEWKQQYVQFFDNFETSLYPQMNTTGSYAANFFIIKRGVAEKYPLWILFNGYGKDADKSVPLDKDRFPYGIMLGVFDWLPIPAPDGDFGDNTFYSGYHQDYNIYSEDNPVPDKGTVKMFVQRRIWESVKWIEANFPMDTTRRYLRGTSSNGYGVVLTGTMFAERIACIYGCVEPTSLTAKTDAYEQMWGLGSTNLKTDVVKWNSSDTLNFKDLTNIAKSVYHNRERNIPPIFDVHGKNDVTVPWNDSRVTWMDSLNNNCIGGARYFDMREHGGEGKTFFAEETEPYYYRFATNLPYPAFSNCDIDQDPGDGTPTKGDDYGTKNGYLDYKDDDFKDKACKYVTHVFIKDLYAGGVLAPQQYTTCKVDITPRRCQNFNPPIGSKIKWTNHDDVTGEKLQHGSFTYNGGLLTLKNITVTKNGNKIKWKIDGCSEKFGEEDEDDFEDDEAVVSFSKSPNGYIAQLNLTNEEQTRVMLFDLMGKLVWEQHISLQAGVNEFEIPATGNGIFLVQVKGESFSQSEKLFF